MPNDMEYISAADELFLEESAMRDILDGLRQQIQDTRDENRRLMEQMSREQQDNWHSAAADRNDMWKELRSLKNNVNEMNNKFVEYEMYKKILRWGFGLVMGMLSLVFGPEMAKVIKAKLGFGQG